MTINMIWSWNRKGTLGQNQRNLNEVWHLVNNNVSTLDEAQAGIKIARRNINLRSANDTTLTAESEEELRVS